MDFGKEIQEITFEANPMSLTCEKTDVLATYDNVTVNIGIQSFVPERLDEINRYSNVEKIKDVEENVTNTKDITIDLGGNTIFGEFINGGILKLINGTIENPNGIGLVNNKSLTLGENDGEIKIEDIKIIGTTLGLEQNGKFNFYDGYLEGEVALHGTTDSVPKGYFLYNEHNDLKDNILFNV